MLLVDTFNQALWEETHRQKRTSAYLPNGLGGKAGHVDPSTGLVGLGPRPAGMSSTAAMATPAAAVPASMAPALALFQVGGGPTAGLHASSLSPCNFCRLCPDPGHPAPAPPPPPPHLCSVPCTPAPAGSWA
jgi:hypothetical protein